MGLSDLAVRRRAFSREEERAEAGPIVAVDNRLAGAAIARASRDAKVVSGVVRRGAIDLCSSTPVKRMSELERLMASVTDGPR
jgi:hypothetical protein